MRFNNFVYTESDRLDEKITKKEIDVILKSNDILVGAEFEFISNDLEKYEEDSSGAEQAFRDAFATWEDHVSELDSWRTDINDWEIGLLGRIDQLGSEIDELRDDKYDAETEENYDLVIELEKEIDEREEEEEDLKYQYDNEIDKPEPPDIPDELVEYDRHYAEGYHGYEYNFNPGDELPEPDSPRNLYDLEDLMSWVRAVEDEVVSTLPRFISKDYEVGVYDSVDQYAGSTTWAIEPDSSLGETGIEIKSPPMTIREFVKICPDMFKWISKNGYTTSDCGFHVHMSIKGIPNLNATIDLTKLTFFTDEELIYKNFGRENSTYSQSVKKQILDRGRVGKQDIKDLIKVKRLEAKVQESHHNSINWEGLSDDSQHIEFRYMGGQGYHKKWDKVKPTIARFAYNINLACNPDFKRKEYLQKVVRMVNRMEVVQIKYRFNALEELLKWIKSEDGTHRILGGGKKGLVFYDEKMIKWIEKYRDSVGKEYQKALKNYEGKPSLIRKLKISDTTRTIINIDIGERLSKKFRVPKRLGAYIIGM